MATEVAWLFFGSVPRASRRGTAARPPPEPKSPFKSPEIKPVPRSLTFPGKFFLASKIFHILSVKNYVIFIDKISKLIYNIVVYSSMCSYVYFSKGADHVAGYGEYENDSVTRQFIINENTPFIVSETYGKIRANLVTALKAAGNKSFVITSQIIVLISIGCICIH